MLDESQQRRPLDQLKVPAAGELGCLSREPTRCDNKAASRPPCRHEAEKLSNDRDANLVCPPLLALNEERFAVFPEHQIDSAVCAASTRFSDLVTLQPERLAHQHLELAPGHAVERIRRLTRRNGGD